MVELNIPVNEQDSKKDSKKVDTISPQIGFDQPDLYLNRELTWLNFNTRVLSEAQDRRIPLLERVKFLSITHSKPGRILYETHGWPQQATSCRRCTSAYD